ncbi:MAG TPA: hypothetical protein P5558_04685, partial [Geminicoccaceae bacterium]|nr:hypothetical protein [Geminicoccaceae bacterium]
MLVLWHARDSATIAGLDLTQLLGALGQIGEQCVEAVVLGGLGRDRLGLQFIGNDIGSRAWRRLVAWYQALDPD